MTIPQQIITVGLCVLGTMLTRFLPFFIFRENQETPSSISGNARCFSQSPAGRSAICCFGLYSEIPLDELSSTGFWLDFLLYTMYLQPICILTPPPTGQLICFRDNKKGISAIRQLLAWIVEIPFFAYP